MYLDKLLQLNASGSLASTIVAAGVASTDVLDLGVARDLGGDAGDEIALVFTVETAMTSAGASTLVLSIQGSADNVTYKDLVRTGAIPKANLTAGKQIQLPLASYLANPEAAIPRYLRGFYSALVADFTGGTFQAALVINPQKNNPPSYPSGFTVAN